MAVATLTRRYESPLISLLGELTVIFYEQIQRAAVKHLDTYPVLRTKVIQIITSEVEKNKVKAEEAIRLIIQAQETFVNTDHPDFQEYTKIIKGVANRYHRHKSTDWCPLFHFDGVFLHNGCYAELLMG